MSPELIGELSVNTVLLVGFLLILGIGCLIADFVFPHIPFIQRWLDSLHDWHDEQ